MYTYNSICQLEPGWLADTTLQLNYDHATQSQRMLIYLTLSRGYFPVHNYAQHGFYI